MKESISTEKMCLVIGSPGVGKTLLLKRLNSCSNRGSYSDIGEAPSTIPTVGTNLVNMLSSNRKQEITIRELGGCMAPIWQNYYKECESVVFMIDMSNTSQISAACIQLMDMLTCSMLQTTPVLLVLNKVDMPNAIGRHELEDVMHLDDILKYAKQKLSILEASAREGQGLLEVSKWIQHNTKPAQN